MSRYLRYRHVFKNEIHSETAIYGWANRGLAEAAAAGDAVARFFEDLWRATASTYRDARREVASAMKNAALKSASTIYQSAELGVLRMCQSAEVELYSELAKRYAAFNDSAAQRRPRWDAGVGASPKPARY